MFPDHNEVNSLSEHETSSSSIIYLKFLFAPSKQREEKKEKKICF